MHSKLTWHNKMLQAVGLTHRVYELAEVEQILTAYRTLFPLDEVTAGLRTYLGWDRSRAWSQLTTDFHMATPEKLHALHLAAVEIELRSRANELTVGDKGRKLAAAAISEGVGFSIGFNPWTDNLLWQTFDPSPNVSRRRLVVVVGHNWYPLGAGADPESPMLDQGLHRTPRYQGFCPEAFFSSEKNDPTVFFMNLFPDFLEPGSNKLGSIKDSNSLSYSECVEGLEEVLRILAPKFETTSVISWGTEAWVHMRPSAEPLIKKVGVKKQAQANPGRLFKWRGHDYLPMSHPSMPNQVEEHLREGFAAMGLGCPRFDVIRRRVSTV
jgi:hypothetical protein